MPIDSTTNEFFLPINADFDSCIVDMVGALLGTSNTKTAVQSLYFCFVVPTVTMLHHFHPCTLVPRFPFSPFQRPRQGHRGEGILWRLPHSLLLHRFNAPEVSQTIVLSNRRRGHRAGHARYEHFDVEMSFPRSLERVH